MGDLIWKAVNDESGGDTTGKVACDCGSNCGWRNSIQYRSDNTILGKTNHQENNRTSIQAMIGHNYCFTFSCNWKGAATKLPPRLDEANVAGSGIKIIIWQDVL